MTTKPPVSKFADEISTKHLEQREGTLADLIDIELAPVRECLEGLKQRELSTRPCWCQSGDLPNSFLEDPAKWKHSDACLAAQQLYERLKIQ